MGVLIVYGGSTNCCKKCGEQEQIWLKLQVIHILWPINSTPNDMTSQNSCIYRETWCTKMLTSNTVNKT